MNFIVKFYIVVLFLFSFESDRNMPVAVIVT